MTQQFRNKTILISRTDAIGDVMLTLPMCGWLKQQVPGVKVLFLGKTYTKDVVNSCAYVDAFLNWDELKVLPQQEQLNKLQEYGIDVVIHVFPDKEVAQLAKKAGIAVRVGTRNRWFHWLTCNMLVPLSRRHSPLHESQLNLELLRPVGLKQLPPLTQILTYLDMSGVAPLPAHAQKWLTPGVPHIILHPKSQGSAREWELENFGALARLLHQRGYQVFVSGTRQDHDLMHHWLAQHQPWLTDITGKLTLSEFISFIKACDGLVGASTGPLHLAAGLGIHALGLYPPIKPIHPGRWGPVGLKAEYLVLDKDCQACRKNPAACVCIKQITVQAVLDRIDAWFKG